MAVLADHAERPAMPRRGAPWPAFSACAARAAALATLLLGLSLPLDSNADESWATSRARSLTAQGDQHRALGNVDLALTRYRQALELDGTFGPAYLKLAELRESTGDRDEAERVLLLGLERIPGFMEAEMQRAGLMTRARRFAEATGMLLSALRLQQDDPALLERLAEVAPRAGNYPVALFVARRRLAAARTAGDPTTKREAELVVTALGMLVAEADPVLAGCEHPEAVRRALCHAARGQARTNIGRAPREKSR